MPSNQEIAGILRQVYELMQLAGENRFKAIAFDRAAQTIEALDDEIITFIESQTLTDIKGVGKSIAEDIYTYASRGSMPVLEAMKEKVPAGLIRWLDISGLGPKNIAKIHQELGITEISELKTACEDGRVAALSGLGEKSAQKIIKSIEWMEQFSERCRLDEALNVADPLVAFLKKQPGVQRIEVAGSLRRHMETIGDVDILVAADESDAPAIFDGFTSHDLVTDILGRGDTKSSVRTSNGRQADLRIVKPEQFASALMYFTGSKEHNVAMRSRARERGMALNEYGLFKLDKEGNTDFDAPVKTVTEEDIYQKLDAKYIPPYHREDRGEFELYSDNDSLNLVQEADIRGVVHAHSTWSDGKYSIREMAEASLKRGYEYLVITDHSKTAAYAGGLSVDDVKRQWDEIDGLNEALKNEGKSFHVFKGIESDILMDGSLDYPDSILDGFDLVIASVHSGLELPQDKMMERFRLAIEHPATRMVGHPTGRLLLRRDGSNLDMNQLIEWAAEHSTAIEINASPWRLDLDWRHGPKARQTGLLTSINPDAHSVEGIDDIRFGVMIAQKARFEKDRVLNTLGLNEFGKWLKV